MLGRYAKLLEEAGHYPAAKQCPVAPLRASATLTGDGPPVPSGLPCAYPPGHDGPHRDHMGNALGPRTYERDHLDRCNKCRTPWPCKTATDLMGPELTGFGPEGDQ